MTSVAIETWLRRVGALLLCGLPLAGQNMQCSVSAGVPPLVRLEGKAELMGDVLISCTGGVAGTSRNLSFRVQLSQPITGRKVNEYSEALLLVDDPRPEQQSAGVNVYQGYTIAANVLDFSGVRIVEPGNSATRTFRINNIRADVSAVPMPIDNSPGQVTLGVSSASVFLTLRSATVAFVLPGSSSVITNPQNQPSTGLGFRTCAGQNEPLVSNSSASGGVISFAVQFREGFQTAFRKRTVSGPSNVEAQNEPGVVYPSETGFFNPSFPPTNGMYRAGLASSGTRLMLQFANVPTGVTIYVTTSDYGYGTTEHILAQLVSTDGAGMSSVYTPVAPTTTAMVDASPVNIAPVTLMNGSGRAVWEILDSFSVTRETVAFGVVVAYAANTVQPALSSVTRTLAPLATVEAPAFPRFTQGTEAHTLNFHACSAPLPDLTVTTLSAPRSVSAASSFDLSQTYANASAATTGPFTTRFALFSDFAMTQRVPGTYDLLACSSPGMAAGQTARCEGTVSIPGNIAPGEYYLSSLVDSQGQIAEASETNNVRSSAFRLTPCELGLESPGWHAGPSGGSDRFFAHKPSPSCVFPGGVTATSQAPWLSVTSVVEGSNAIEVHHTVAPNPGAPRLASIQIQGKTFTIRQAGTTNAASTLSVTPQTASGVSRQFVVRVSDADGSHDPTIVDLLIGPALGKNDLCLLRYNARWGTISLFSDDGESADEFDLRSTGPYLLENSQCSLDRSTTSVSSSGNTLTITLTIFFKKRFVGNQSIFAGVVDIAGLISGTSNGWQRIGSFSVVYPNATPAAGQMTPALVSASSQVITFTFSDNDGWEDLDVVNILINSALDGRGACYLAYSRRWQTLYVVNDAGDALLPQTLWFGSPTGSISNTQCAINSVGSSVSGTASTLTVTLNVTFSTSFRGAKIVHLAARDIAHGNSGWQPLGLLRIAPSGPAPVIDAAGSTPVRGVGTETTLRFRFNSSTGWQNLGVLNVLINFGLDGRNGCYIAYSRPQNRIFLVNDGGTALVPSSIIPGTNASVANSYCTILGNGSSATGSGTTFELSLRITFDATAFRGNKVVFAAGRDTQELNNTGWLPVATWTVP